MQPEIRDPFQDAHGFNREGFALDLASADLVQIDLAVSVSRKLLREQDAAGDLVGIQGLFDDEHLSEGLANDLPRVFTAFQRLYAQHGDIIMGGLDIYRHNAATFDTGLSGNLRLHTAGFKFSALVVEEITIGSSQEGDFSIPLHPDKIVRAYIRFSLDQLYLHNRLAVQLRRCYRGRSQIQYALAGRVLRREVFSALLAEKPRLYAGKRVAYGLVVQISRGQAARAAKL